MKDLLRAGVTFLAGAAVGGFLSYYITKNYYKSVAEEEIESVKEMARRKAQKYETEIQDVKDEKKVYEKAVKDAGLKVYSSETLDDSAYGEQDSPPEDSTEVENKLYQSSPYFIDEEQYSTEALHYEKIELRYYAEDKTYCDENDEIFNDKAEFGEEVEKQIVAAFEDLANEEYLMVYLRNDSLASDYEIQYIQNSYQEAVLGVKEEE